MKSQHHPGKQETTAQTQGAVWNWAWGYDLVIGLLTAGQERRFRRRIADLARLHPGEAVLDVGCGTGTLAMLAKEQVGALGHVAGIDPSGQMIARARRKAERAGLSMTFQVGMIEQLAFPDQSFDVVLSTFMMHHLPDDLKQQGLAEVARVLKPGGRLLVIDLTGPAGPWKSRMRDLPSLLKEIGFSALETGKPPFPGLSVASARKEESQHSTTTTEEIL